uniref:Transthyretin-like protein 46 n=1 Tax=Trichuris muris TaxID=70415 RepID=A0A5S6QWB2_TRIMR
MEAILRTSSQPSFSISFRRIFEDQPAGAHAPACRSCIQCDCSMSFKQVLLLVFVFHQLVRAGEWQCIAVTGNVRCNGKLSTLPVLVRLKDDDIGYDDLMDEGYVSKQGSFYLNGCASDLLGSIDPYVSLYHKCKDTPKRVVLRVPYEGTTNNFTYTFPLVIDLAEVHKEETDHAYHVPKCPEVAMESTRL